MGDESLTPQKASWNAIFSIAFGALAIVTAEFLPISLLTPMAQGLGVTGGQAGQTVTVTAAMATIVALVITAVVRTIDRRWVIMAFTALQVASNLCIAYAPNLTVALAGAALLGISLGGFWSMATAATIRLAPPTLVPRALSIIFSGVFVATIAAMSFGSYAGNLIGWRNVFLLGAAIGSIALYWQIGALPSIAASHAARLSTMIEVTKSPLMRAGLIAIILLYVGHFMFFTYLRPFLENVTKMEVHGISTVLLGFGIAGFIGTPLAGWQLTKSVRLTLVMIPSVMVLTGFALAIVGGTPAATAVLIALWGMAFGGAPVGWSFWITRTIPDEVESGSGLLVATSQLSVAIGGAAGGVVFDRSGSQGVLIAATLTLLIATIVTSIGLRSGKAATL